MITCSAIFQRDTKFYLIWQGSKNLRIFFASDSKLTGPSVTPAPKEESKNVSTEDDKKKEEAKKEMIKNCGDMGISHKIAIEACNRVKELKMDLVLDEV